MNEDDALTAMGALAHRCRMRVFRMLVRAGPSGLCAGDIASRLALSPSALSFHLAHLERAGLLRSWRSGRNSMYAVALEGMRRLLMFLTEDCCNGHPEVCGALFTAAGEAGRTAPLSAKASGPRQADDPEAAPDTG